MSSAGQDLREELRDVGPWGQSVALAGQRRDTPPTD